jgi:hypothetical protein
MSTTFSQGLVWRERDEATPLDIQLVSRLRIEEVSSFDGVLV